MDAIDLRICRFHLAQEFPCDPNRTEFSRNTCSIFLSTDPREQDVGGQMANRQIFSTSFQLLSPVIRASAITIAELSANRGQSVGADGVVLTLT